MREPCKPKTIHPFVDAAAAVMALGSELLTYRPGRREWLLKKNNIRCRDVRGFLYTQANESLSALFGAGIELSDAKKLVKAIVGIANTFLKFSHLHMGQAPPPPNPECEPEDDLQDLTPKQARIIQAQHTAYRHFDEAKGDFLITWTAVYNPRKKADSNPIYPSSLLAVAAPDAVQELLFGWPQIPNAVKMKDIPENSRNVLLANKEYDGPIVPPRKGGRPQVAKAPMLQWWNRLANTEFVRQRDNDTKAEAAVEGQHNYGRDATVAPEIKGSVKKRRKQGGK